MLVGGILCASQCGLGIWGSLGAGVGLCISVAVWTARGLVMVFTLPEEDVVMSFGGRKKEVVYLRKSRR
jgi:hypothetical protein